MPTVVQSDRLTSLVQELPFPNIQLPSLFVLIGNREKSNALGTLFRIPKSRRSLIKANYGDVHLHLDPSTAFDDRPIMLAGCNVRKRSTNQVKVRRYEFQGAPGSSSRLRFARSDQSDDGPIRLLFPFADVFCFFSDDLGGFRYTAQYLASWLKMGVPSTHPGTMLPSIVIITSKFSPSEEAEEEAKRAFLWMLEEETTLDLYQHVSTITLVSLLPKGAISADARYRRVKECIMKCSDAVRQTRETKRALCSATHLAAFMKGASEHEDCLHSSFDFVQASRAHNPIATDLSEHISNFLKHITSSNQLTTFAAPMLASTLLLDSYPPDTHSKYDFHKRTDIV